MWDLGLEGQVRCQQNILGRELQGRQFVKIQSSPPLLPMHTISRPNLNLGLGVSKAVRHLGCLLGTACLSFPALGSENYCCHVSPSSGGIG